MVCVFARKTSEPLTSLVKQIDQKIGESAGLKSFLVLLTDKDAKPAADLKKLAQDAGIKNVPLTLHQDLTGPPDYELGKDADVTVLMWNKHRVKVSRAFKGPLTDQDVQAVVADIPNVLKD